MIIFRNRTISPKEASDWLTALGEAVTIGVIGKEFKTTDDGKLWKFDGRFLVPSDLYPLLTPLQSGANRVELRQGVAKNASWTDGSANGGSVSLNGSTGVHELRITSTTSSVARLTFDVSTATKNLLVLLSIAGMSRSGTGTLDCGHFGVRVMDNARMCKFGMTDDDTLGNTSFCSSSNSNTGTDTGASTTMVMGTSGVFLSKFCLNSGNACSVEKLGSNASKKVVLGYSDMSTASSTQRVVVELLKPSSALVVGVDINYFGVWEIA